ncbi:SRPBCC family protein [Nocardia sp. NPDC050406]|uniref:SRPBCC family protein n=1 Tax=Nocardia sp. NPDC050406 TaxID=3364318 RepID=UPI0037A1DB08
MSGKLMTAAVSALAGAAVAALYTSTRRAPRAASRFALEPVPGERSGDYLANAPAAITVHAEIPASPETVFAALVDESCFSWLPGVSGFHYECAHRGVGTTRVLLNPAMTVREEFTVYEEGARLDYTFTGSSLPMLKSAVESYELQPLAAASTLLTVRVGMTPRLAAPGFVARPLLRAFTEQAVRGLSRSVSAPVR